MITLLLSVLPEEQKAAVEKVFRRDRGLFIKIALEYLHDKQHAEDAVQEALVKVILHIEEISALSDREQKNYCAMIVRNTAIDMVRKERHGSALEIDENRLIQENPAEDIPEQLDSKRIVEKALSRLSKEEINLLYLRHEKELTYREIGALMGITEDAAKKRGKRILERLRKVIESTEME